MTIIMSLGGATAPSGYSSVWEQVIRGSSTVDQNPTAVGDAGKMQVSFGPAATSDYMDLAADGALSIKVTDSYKLRLSTQYGRSSPSGVSWLYLRVLINGVQSGQTVLAQLDNAKADFPYQAELFGTLPAGSVLTVELMRGAEGTNDGGMIYVDPSATAGNGSWNPVYSADMLVSRLSTSPL